MIMPSQLRAARGLLRLSQEGLADLAIMGKSTIRRAEQGRASQATMAKIEQALTIAGAVFTEEITETAGAIELSYGVRQR